MTTLRRNSLKQIRAILEKAALITGHVYDDTTGGDAARMTLEQVMAKAERFKRVDLDDDGRLHINLGGNDTVNAYPSIEVARKVLSAIAFAKYYPEEGQAHLEATLDTNIARAEVRQANAFDEIAAARVARELANLRALRWKKVADRLGFIAENDDQA